jgi:sugar-specific transcriptional regulator TrmB
LAELLAMKNKYKPLYEYGLDKQNIKIYETILSLGRCNIKKIQKSILPDMNLSYSQVYSILKKLKRLHMIEEHSGGEKSFTPIDPELMLEKIKKENIVKIDYLKNEFSDIFKRTTYEFGQCTIHVNMFTFTSLELGYQIIINKFIKNANKSIVFLAPPPILIKRLKLALIDAYERGVEIEIHYSIHDFEELEDYYIEILPLIKDFRVKLFKRKYRLHEPVSINDEYTRMGNLIIDKVTLVSTPYYKKSIKKGVVNYDIDYFSGFYHFPLQINNIFSSLQMNEIIQMMDILPPNEAALFELLRYENKVPKNLIASKLSLSGTKLKAFLDKLERMNKIIIRRESEGRGRPKEYVELNAF